MKEYWKCIYASNIVTKNMSCQNSLDQYVSIKNLYNVKNTPIFYQL